MNNITLQKYDKCSLEDINILNREKLWKNIVGRFFDYSTTY